MKLEFAGQFLEKYSHVRFHESAYKVHSSPSTPRRHTKATELWLHSFLALVLDRGE